MAETNMASDRVDGVVALYGDGGGRAGDGNVPDMAAGNVVCAGPVSYTHLRAHETTE